MVGFMVFKGLKAGWIHILYLCFVSFLYQPNTCGGGGGGGNEERMCIRNGEL